MDRKEEATTYYQMALGRAEETGDSGIIAGKLYWKGINAYENKTDNYGLDYFKRVLEIKEELFADEKRDAGNKDTYALIGNPVGHSLSDILHKKVFELKNEDKDYLLIESQNIECTIEILKEKCKGFNVTVPFKSQVIPYLDFIDVTAKEIGAVNTVLIKDNKLYGYNSDYYGFLR
jgi:shikimate dehydrogenase